MNKIAERLEALREELRREHLSAFVFPTTGPHNSEYTADHWKGREWISGFTGSAGTAVVTLKSAALWTDSRYFIQAAEQLKGTEFQLMKLKIEGTPSIPEWIASELSTSDSQSSTEIGMDGMVNTVAVVEKIKEELKQRGGITVRTNFDPLARIWKDRPQIPQSPVEIQPMELAGEETTSKLIRIRQALRARHADGMLVTALDDIAWTLNLRGSDVHCNPVFVSYLLIDTQKVTLYVDQKKLDAAVRNPDKLKRDEDIAAVKAEVVEHFIEEYPEATKEIAYVLHKMTKEIVRRMITHEKIRPDGRGLHRFPDDPARAGGHPGHRSGLPERGRPGRRLPRHGADRG